MSGQMTLGEYGNVLYINADYVLTGATVTIDITKPNGSTLSVAATIGTSDLSTPEGTFSANKYAYYTFANGDIDQVGAHTARLNAVWTAPAKKLISPGVSFTVNA